jgi:hypothetical protein
MNNSQLIGKATLMSAVLGLSIAGTYGAAVPVDPKTTVTASMDGGITKSGNTWYELGVNKAAPTTGLKTGFVLGQTDPFSTYLIQPATGNNALMLDTNRSSGTLTFTRPLSFTALSLAGSSGNGSGTNTLTLHFSDGSTDKLAPIVAGDWFGVEPRVQTSHGRIDVGANVFNNVNDDNPRVLALNTTLSAADASKLITSIDIDWTGSGANTHTAIFGISGDIGVGHFTAIPLAVSSFNQDLIVGLSEVPEPGTMALLGLGAAGVIASYFRRRS